MDGFKGEDFKADISDGNGQKKKIQKTNCVKFTLGFGVL